MRISIESYKLYKIYIEVLKTQQTPTQSGRDGNCPSKPTNNLEASQRDYLKWNCKKKGGKSECPKAEVETFKVFTETQKKSRERMGQKMFAELILKNVPPMTNWIIPARSSVSRRGWKRHAGTDIYTGKDTGDSLGGGVTEERGRSTQRLRQGHRQPEGAEQHTQSWGKKQPCEPPNLYTVKISVKIVREFKMFSISK